MTVHNAGKSDSGFAGIVFAAFLERTVGIDKSPADSEMELNVRQNAPIPLLERRRYPRFDLEDGALFSDKEQRIGFGRILNISRCGAKCVSLSDICCEYKRVENVEIYIPQIHVDLKNLSIRVAGLTKTQCHSSKERTVHTVFRIEFLEECLSQVPDFNIMLSGFKR